MSSERQADNWDYVITANTSWFDFRFREIWNYRHLIAMFVRRDFVAGYKQTIFGPLWYLIPPLLSTITFTVIFGTIANIPTDGAPKFLFYMSGIIFWGYFAAVLMANASVFSGQSGLFSKVYFPRLIVPLANAINSLVSFTVTFVIFLGFVVYSMSGGAAVMITSSIVLLPLLILLSAALGLSVGILASALTARFRDLSFLVNYGLSLWMYLTPIIYPISVVPEKYQWLLLLNPMSSIVIAFRHATLGIGEISYLALAYSAVFAVVALFGGMMIFNRVERYAMDTV
jgi:lipopolysaccharide transport system permease protein